MFPKIVEWYPQIIPLENKVFHYFHHPFWGTPIFGNTQECPKKKGILFWGCDWDHLAQGGVWIRVNKKHLEPPTRYVKIEKIRGVSWCFTNPASVRLKKHTGRCLGQTNLRAVAVMCRTFIFNGVIHGALCKWPYKLGNPLGNPWTKS